MVGDTANTTARLSAAAAPGEVVLSGAAVAATDADTSILEQRSLVLKGKAKPFEAWVWTVSDPVPLEV